jgi:hypothetical protein
MFSIMHIAFRSIEPHLARLLVTVALALAPSAALAQQDNCQLTVDSCQKQVSVTHLTTDNQQLTTVLGSFLDRFFVYVNAALGSQHRMLQFGIIGMCIGLFILMRR